MTVVVTSVRNLTRSFLCNSWAINETGPSSEDIRETDAVIKVLLAMLAATKDALRAEWAVDHNHPSLSLVTSTVSLAATSFATPHFSTPSLVALKPDYDGLISPMFGSLEHRGLSLPIHLSMLVEKHIRRGFSLNHFHGPQASQLTVQLNTLIDAYGNMETVKTTPIPVALLIHARQVLALYSCVLPFAMVDDLGWWAIPIVALATFTLYGIEGIGAQLEDPFGYEKNDIKMDAIVEDVRVEINALLQEWRTGRGVFELQRVDDSGIMDS